MKNGTNKIASDLRKLAARAYMNTWSGKVLETTTEREQIAFHRMHRVFLRKCTKDRQKVAIEDRYPFVRVDSVWYVSLPKLYCYFFGIRNLLAQFEDKDIQAIYSGIQSASRYYDKAKELDLKLTPHGHIDFEDYRQKMADLYREYQTEQMTIFG